MKQTRRAQRSPCSGPKKEVCVPFTFSLSVERLMAIGCVVVKDVESWESDKESALAFVS